MSSNENDAIAISVDVHYAVVKHVRRLSDKSIVVTFNGGNRYDYSGVNMYFHSDEDLANFVASLAVEFYKLKAETPISA